MQRESSRTLEWHKRFTRTLSRTGGDKTASCEPPLIYKLFAIRVLLSLENFSIQDDIITTPTKTAQPMSSTPSSFWHYSRVIFRKTTNQSPDTIDDIPVGAEVKAISSLLLPLKNQGAIIRVSSVGLVRPRA